jgi:ribosomal protein S1
LASEGVAVSEPPRKPARRRAPSNFRQQDVARAIKAAKGSGLDIVRVEVDPKTAKITLVVKNDDNTESKSDVNPFDSAPVPEPTRQTRKKKPCA